MHSPGSHLGCGEWTFRLLLYKKLFLSVISLSQTPPTYERFDNNTKKRQRIDGEVKILTFEELRLHFEYFLHDLAPTQWKIMDEMNNFLAFVVLWHLAFLCLTINLMRALSDFRRLNWRKITMGASSNIKVKKRKYPIRSNIQHRSTTKQRDNKAINGHEKDSCIRETEISLWPLLARLSADPTDRNQGWEKRPLGVVGVRRLTCFPPFPCLTRNLMRA
jgi:hypothetical protein